MKKCLLTLTLIVIIGTNVSATTLTQLTNNPGTDWMPSWSPDGSMIVYVASPNAINHQSDPTQDIYTIPVTGGTPTKLTSYDGVDGYSPRYSPDGSKIIYSTTMGNNNYFDLGLWTIPSTGGIPTKIYDSPANDFNPAWSPDGTRIVFYSEQTSPRSLWIVSSNGANPWRLTWDNEDYNPDWGLDGSTIVAHSTYRTGNQELWIISAIDGTATQLTNTSWSEYTARYSPDGKWIAFGSDRSGTNGVWIMPATGGEQILITDKLGWGVFPCWSPDGTKIAFSSGDPQKIVGPRDIWIASDLPINPIPEPSTILLLTTGLGGMAVYRFRKRKKS